MLGRSSPYCWTFVEEKTSVEEKTELRDLCWVNIDEKNFDEKSSVEENCIEIFCWEDIWWNNFCLEKGTDKMGAYDKTILAALGIGQGWFWIIAFCKANIW